MIEHKITTVRDVKQNIEETYGHIRYFQSLYMVIENNDEPIGLNDEIVICEIHTFENNPILVLDFLYDPQPIYLTRINEPEPGCIGGCGTVNLMISKIQLDNCIEDDPEICLDSENPTYWYQCSNGLSIPCCGGWSSIDVYESEDMCHEVGEFECEDAEFHDPQLIEYSEIAQKLMESGSEFVNYA